MYHFVNLNDEQAHERRQLLDFYGLVAQLSVLVPLVAIAIGIIIQKCLSHWTPDAPSSPRAKAARHSDFSNVKYQWRRAYTIISARNHDLIKGQVTWWSATPVHVSGYLLGTKVELAGATAWTIWLLLLSFLDTGEDYLHLTKRFGAVGASQLPFHYLLSLKSPWSPLRLMTGYSEATLLSIHQILGRIITGLLLIHSALYINFYIRNSLLLAKLKAPYVLCGVFAIIAFSVMTTTALAVLRNKSYRLFYYTHVSLATALLPVLYFHVHHIRTFIYETAGIYAVNAIFRYIASKTLTGTLQQLHGTNLIEVSIPLDKDTATKWQPGQHAYISLAGHPFLRTFRSNPFTQASLPSIDHRLRFVARILDGNTAVLARSVREHTMAISVEGPYGLGTHSTRLLQYDRVLFVAGGIGSTFIVPLYRQLLSDLSPSQGSYRRQKVTFVWVARNRADVTWALPADTKRRDGLVERLVVHLSRETGGTDSQPDNGAFTVDTDADDGPDEEGIELDEQKNLLQGDSAGGPREESTPELQIYSGRPNLSSIVDQTFSHSSSEKVAIVVCGPRQLSRDLRESVHRWVKKGRDVWFWDESFAL